MALAKVKRKGDDYDIPNEVDGIHLINESRVEPYYGCEAGPSNQEATNINVEDGGTDVKQEMVDDAHWNDMVSDVEHALLEQKFDSVEDGEAFYNAYAKAKGFSIRKSRFNTNKQGKVVSRLWLCSRKGQRLPNYLDRVAEKSKAPKALTRVGCKAQFRRQYDPDAGEGGKYVVTHFVANHNHELAEQHYVMYLRSHRGLNSADKAQAMVTHNVGVKTSQIMDYMVNQSESYENDNKLQNPFWADSKSRAGYAKFGDVLIFDSTYRTNAYTKPFVMLAGVTNHFTTMIFACVLLANETIDTYTWVLETFIEAMGNKAPVSVLIDGDKAMREAIRRVFPDARHRLCNWHLGKNVVSNVHKSGFAHAFKQCMDMETDEAKFEDGWTRMVEKLDFKPIAGHYDRALTRIRYNEARDDAETNNTFPPVGQYGSVEATVCKNDLTTIDEVNQIPIAGCLFVFHSWLDLTEGFLAVWFIS
ncbi:protein FAR1-RELATED SEQUENCE 5-like [Camellia sinensis]|uniref:protein FAR1-RELATED SEQUENCE 5-like n=1 Tax=Camellia sinensis TaxID=4442 RepID=UPI001035839A|nr:protein FAR1-RELATED SEQUENCE 5-like [Camellia sinensis]